MRALFSKSYRSNSENILAGCLTKDANCKQDDSYARCFDANFEQQKNAHNVFLKLYLPSKMTVAKSLLTPISSKKRVAHRVSDKL